MASASRPARNSGILGFADFKLDPSAEELRRNGSVVRLQRQPLQLLTYLAQHSGEVVTREELRQLLWRDDTFVDFDNGLNAAINKVREALGDSAENPRFVETLPRRGYRFIARVEATPDSVAPITMPPKAGTTQSAELREVEPPPPRPRHQRRILVTAIVALAAVAGALYWLFRPRTPVVTAIHQLTHSGRQKVLGSADTPGSTLHPHTDGSRVYFQEWTGNLWRLAQVSTKGGDVSYPDTSFISFPWIHDISKDGSKLLVAYPDPSKPDQPFWVLPLPEGAPRRVPGEFLWMSFVPGTDQIVYQQSSDLKRVFTAKEDGSGGHELVSLPGDVGQYFALSPDGKRARFATADGRSWESRLDGNGMRRFLPEFTSPVAYGYWSPGGGLFVFASPEQGVWNLWGITQSAWPFTRIESRPTRLTSGPISFRYSTSSNDGKQIFAIGETPRGELSVYDPKSGLFAKYGSGLSAGFTDFSRDGQWIAYVSHPDGMLWRSRIDGSERLQLTFPPMGPILNPKWSPDGRFILFTDFNEWAPKIYLISADGGAPRLLASGDFKPQDPSWSPDGRSVAYGGSSIPGGAATEIRLLNLETKQSNTVPGSQGLRAPRWSPDGQYIAAQSADGTQLSNYSFQTGSWKQLPVPKGPHGTYLGWPAWSHDSRNLYYMIGSNVYKAPISGAPPEVVASTGSIDIICPVFAWAYWFALTPDDQILVLRDRSVQEIYALDVEYP